MGSGGYRTEGFSQSSRDTSNNITTTDNRGSVRSVLSLDLKWRLNVPGVILGPALRVRPFPRWDSEAQTVQHRPSSHTL